MREIVIPIMKVSVSGDCLSISGALMSFSLTEQLPLGCFIRFLKDEDLGFIAEPHVSPVEEIPAAHTGFLVVASDGLWDVLPEERAATMILKASAEEGRLQRRYFFSRDFDKATPLRPRRLSPLILRH